MTGGIDLGGTKIETALFDRRLQKVASRRVRTPQADYGSLLHAVRQELSWLEEQSGSDGLPVGVGLPGLVDPGTGRSLTTNLPATGSALKTDLSARWKGRIAVENDCKCFTLSEANGGSGEGFDLVFGLIIGTGLGGGVCRSGALQGGLNRIAGEVGHIPLPAHLVEQYDLPLLACGCGRTGCYETLVSGTGIRRLAERLLSRPESAEQLADNAMRNSAVHQQVLKMWSCLAAELLVTVQCTLDPDCIVIGGGVSNLPGVDEMLRDALSDVALPCLRLPAIRLSRYGDASGARGAALLAMRDLAR